VAVDDALGSGAHQLRLSCVERFLCCFLVAQCQRFLDLAKEGANARAAVLVDRSAAGDFSRSLLGRRRVGHGASLSKLMSMLASPYQLSTDTSTLYNTRGGRGPPQLGWLIEELSRSVNA